MPAAQPSARAWPAQSDALDHLAARGYEVAERGYALLGYAAAGPQAGLLLATRVREKAVLPGGHVVYAVTDSSWAMVPLQVRSRLGRGAAAGWEAAGWCSQTNLRLPCRPAAGRCGCLAGSSPRPANAAERGGGRCGGGGAGGAAAAARPRRLLARAAAVHAEQRALLLRNRRHIAPFPQACRARFRRRCCLLLLLPAAASCWLQWGAVGCRCCCQACMPACRLACTAAHVALHQPPHIAVLLPRPCLLRLQPRGRARPRARVPVERLAAPATGGAGPVRPLPRPAAGVGGWAGLRLLQATVALLAAAAAA